MIRRRSRCGRLIAFGLVLAALAVSSAQAQTAPLRPDDRAGAEPVAPRHVTLITGTRKDDGPSGLAPLREPVPAVVLPVRPDDRAGPRGPGIGPSIVYAVGSSAFSWYDAGAGFGAATGIVLLAGGFLLVARRHRKNGLPAV